MGRKFERFMDWLESPAMIMGINTDSETNKAIVTEWMNYHNIK